jgi:hypothetical protein
MRFIVLGLPRSRTAWLAKFLTYGDYICGHEELRHARSLDDVKTWIGMGYVGSAETAAAPWWRTLLRLAPDVRVVIVRRPVRDVVESLVRLGFDPASSEPVMRRLEAKLRQAAKRIPGALVVEFDALNDEAICAKVFEHCLPYKYDSLHWARWASVNVQCDMRMMTRYAVAFRPQLEKLASVAKHYELKELVLKPVTDPETVTLQVEDCATWRKDGKKLFEEHCAIVGEDPREWQTKNWALFDALERIGAMQIVTARSNGRMFGYLMTVLSPSLVNDGILSATNTTFYADPGLPGLGGKIQRFALQELRDRGVNEVFWEAGKRGSGPRIGALYRRLGAAEHGETYRLQLTEH